MRNKQRVLILCTGNSARSQMAEGLLRHDAGDNLKRWKVSLLGTVCRLYKTVIRWDKSKGVTVSGNALVVGCVAQAALFLASTSASSDFRWDAGVVPV